MAGATEAEDSTGLIVTEIATAKREVLVQAYSFTSAPIVKALVDAKKRGVDVRVILDKSQAGQRKEAVSDYSTTASSSMALNRETKC